MTGYQSKKGMARDKLAHMTFEQRCRVSEQCLPEAPYRAMLVALHDEMLEALAQPAQEPWPEEPFGHMAGGVQPPQRPWVGLTDEERVSFDATNPKTKEEWNKLFDGIEDKPKEKNNG